MWLAVVVGRKVQPTHSNRVESWRRKQTTKSNQHHGRPQILSTSTSRYVLMINKHKRDQHWMLSCRFSCTTGCVGEVERVEDNRAIVACAKETRKTVLSVDKKGFLRWNLVLWMWRWTQRDATLTHSRQTSAKAPASAPTHKKIFICGAYINVYGEAICVQKNGWILWKAWQWWGRNTSFTIYYWWPHEKRHLSPEKPLETSSLYTYPWNYRSFSSLPTVEQQNIKYDFLSFFVVLNILDASRVEQETK